MADGQISQTFESEILKLEASVLVDPSVGFCPCIYEMLSLTSRSKQSDTYMSFHPSSSDFGVL